MGFFHCLPVPELWEWDYPFPFPFPNAQKSFPLTPAPHREEVDNRDIWHKFFREKEGKIPCRFCDCVAGFAVFIVIVSLFLHKLEEWHLRVFHIPQTPSAFVFEVILSVFAQTIAVFAVIEVVLAVFELIHAVFVAILNVFKLILAVFALILAVYALILAVFACSHFFAMAGESKPLFLHKLEEWHLRVFLFPPTPSAFVFEVILSVFARIIAVFAALEVTLAVFKLIHAVFVELLNVFKVILAVFALILAAFALKLAVFSCSHFFAKAEESF